MVKVGLSGTGLHPPLVGSTTQEPFPRPSSLGRCSSRPHIPGSLKLKGSSNSSGEKGAIACVRPVAGGCIFHFLGGKRNSNTIPFTRMASCGAYTLTVSLCTARGEARHGAFLQPSAPPIPRACGVSLLPWESRERFLKPREWLLEPGLEVPSRFRAALHRLRAPSTRSTPATSSPRTEAAPQMHFRTEVKTYHRDCCQKVALAFGSSKATLKGPQFTAL